MRQPSFLTLFSLIALAFVVTYCADNPSEDLGVYDTTSDEEADSNTGSDHDEDADSEISPGVEKDSNTNTSAEHETDSGTETETQTAFECDEDHSDRTVDLKLCRTGASKGYTLIAPMQSSNVYLIDMLGKEVHRWKTDHRPGLATYLLESGHLLRTVSTTGGPGGISGFPKGGAGGGVQLINWNGEIEWQFELAYENALSHHDVEMLPSGNVLIIVWERKNEQEAIAAGRNPTTIDSYLLPDAILEVKPFGDSGGEIVWEWHVWDHLVQDYDTTKPNYGVVSEHPELIDLNYVPKSLDMTDWNHINSVDYNKELDQIVLSSHSLSEIWIIDHSTTTAEAAGHTGGKSQRGGDFLYRYGNPAVYDRGDSSDQVLFAQHDAHWIEAGLQGAGHLLIFNNGQRRTPLLSYSSVDEIALPVNDQGEYALSSGEAYLPEDLHWTFVAKEPEDFFSQNISGAQRLLGGNTLICSGANGEVFEVTEAGEIVWLYVNPIGSQGPIAQGEQIPENQSGKTNTLFRAVRYPPSFAAFAGRDLTPGDSLSL